MFLAIPELEVEKEIRKLESQSEKPANQLLDIILDSSADKCFIL
jgi:hypothetical protein